MKPVDYLEFRDRMIVGIADSPHHDDEDFVDLETVSDALNIYDPSRISVLAAELHSGDLADVAMGLPYRVRLKSAGLVRAEEIRRSRLKKSLGQKIASLPYGKGVWEIIKLSIAALFGALAKSYFG